MMDDKKIIAKIKALKNIKPDKNWVLQTKMDILGSSSREDELRNWLRKQAKFLIPALSLSLVAFFLYNSYYRTIPAPESEAPVNSEGLEAVANSLKTVESNLVEATNSLGKVNEPKKVLKIKQTVNTALESGKEIVAAAKTMSAEPQDSGQVLAAVSGVENALKEMRETYLARQEILASQLIEDLENSFLSDPQKELLQEAKNYYQNNDFENALIKAVEASQTR